MSNVKYYISDINDGNLGTHIGDKNSALINRKKLSEKIGVDKKNFIFLNQIHSEDIVVFEDENMLEYEGDAIITKKKGFVIGVLVADCVPIVLYDEDANIISAVHAGWRGTEKKILGKTLMKMLDLGAKISNIKAIFGPSISIDSYEVGKEVSDFFRPDVKKDLLNGKYLLDLKKENKLQLLENGISEGNIITSYVDTFINETYFSARRENIGRFGIFIWID